jgi:hypothetical protein
VARDSIFGRWKFFQVGNKTRVPRQEYNCCHPKPGSDSTSSPRPRTNNNLENSEKPSTQVLRRISVVSDPRFFPSSEERVRVSSYFVADIAARTRASRPREKSIEHRPHTGRPPSHSQSAIEFRTLGRRSHFQRVAVVSATTFRARSFPPSLPHLLVPPRVWVIFFSSFFFVSFFCGVPVVQK